MKRIYTEADTGGESVTAKKFLSQEKCTTKADSLNVGHKMQKNRNTGAECIDFSLSNSFTEVCWIDMFGHTFYSDCES